MDKLTVGKVAKYAKVNVETIRYYQRIKLLETPLKEDSGFRYYDTNFADKVKFIKQSQRLGFSLTEISELLSFENNSKGSASEIKRKAGLKVMQIEDKIEHYQSLKKYLIELIDSCSGDGTIENCPIYSAMK